MARLQGIFCPHMVPMNANGAINETELRRLIDFLIERGISGLYPNGSTGEFVRMEHAERKRIVKIAAEQCAKAGREVPILAGSTECNVDVTVDTLNTYADYGARAGALIGPYYYPMSQDTLKGYFEEIANRSRLDILLYNIPQFSNEIAVDTLVSLCEHPRIIGTKDSARDLPRFIVSMNKIRRIQPDFVFLIGCEEILLPSLIMGGDGGTIATSGVMPEMIMKLYSLFREGHIEEARRIQYQMLDLIEVMLTGADFPEGFRAGMSVRGFDMGPGRMHRTAAARVNLESITRTIQCLIAEHGLVDAPANCPAPRGVGAGPATTPAFAGASSTDRLDVDEDTVRQIVSRILSQLGG